MDEDETDPFAVWRERMASGKPILQFVADMPMTFSLGPGGIVQLDFPFGLAGFDQAGIQRVSILMTPPQLAAVCQVLIDKPDEPVKVTKAHLN